MTDLPSHDADHARHDALLIAAHAAGDLSGRDLDATARLLDGCRACARLHADLRLLAKATRDVPTPRRPRDFRLTADDAARLRRRSWRGVFAALAGPQFSLARPVGAALTSLGLAGLMVAALPGGFTFGGPTAGAPARDDFTVAQPAPGQSGPLFGETDTRSEEHLNGAGGSAAPQGQGPGTGDQGGATEVDPATHQVSTTASADDRETVAERATDATLVILSGSFLIVGLGLFGLRWTARRLGDG